MEDNKMNKKEKASVKVGIEARMMKDELKRMMERNPTMDVKEAEKRVKEAVKAMMKRVEIA